MCSLPDGQLHSVLDIKVAVSPLHWANGLMPRQMAKLLKRNINFSQQGGLHAGLSGVDGLGCQEFEGQPRLAALRLDPFKGDLIFHFHQYILGCTRLDLYTSMVQNNNFSHTEHLYSSSL